MFSHLVCDIIRSQDIPIGIRQTLIPVPTTNDQETKSLFFNIQEDVMVIIICLWMKKVRYYLNNDKNSNIDEQYIYRISKSR